MVEELAELGRASGLVEREEVVVLAGTGLAFLRCGTTARNSGIIDIALGNRAAVPVLCPVGFIIRRDGL